MALVGHTGRLNYASFSPDGTRVVTASQDHTARIWDARSGLELHQLTGHTEPLTCAEFSPDGGTRDHRPAVDGTAQLWDAGSGRELEVGFAREAITSTPPRSRPTVTRCWCPLTTSWLICGMCNAAR